MEKIVILDLGGNARQIASIIRKLNVYCDILPYADSTERVISGGYNGVIIAGSARPTDAQKEPDRALFECGLPILAICSGAVMMARALGADVETCPLREGVEPVVFDSTSRLLSRVPAKTSCFLSYSESIEQVPVDFKIIAKAQGCHVAAMECVAKRLYGVQFAPENARSQDGLRMISNFVFNICGCVGEWTASFLAKSAIRNIKAQYEGKKVICMLSGELKSTLAAVLMHKALGSRLICVMPDISGVRSELLDKTEQYLAGEDIRVVREDHTERVLGQLVGVTDYKQKKITVSRELVRIITEHVKRLAGADYLVSTEQFLSDQPDSIIETAADFLGSGVAKPLEAFNVNDTVRAARELGIPEELIVTSAVGREGLYLFVSGTVTAEKLSAIARADAVFTEELIREGIADGTAEFFVGLTECADILCQSEDAGLCITLCMPKKNDGLRLSKKHLPTALIDAVSLKIVSEIPEASRVLYDVTF